MRGFGAPKARLPRPTPDILAVLVSRFPAMKMKPVDVQKYDGFSGSPHSDAKRPLPVRVKSLLRLVGASLVRVGAWLVGVGAWLVRAGA